MEYGLIGEKLKHSFSKEIHERIGKYEYELVELNKDEFDSFMTHKNFKAINVTIPYKQEVIKYLDYISDEAKKINSVNTIVNKNGKLYGYNTDYLGFKEMLAYFNINITDKNVMILGTGGTANTVSHVVKDLNAKSITFVSRNAKENVITYENVKDYSKEIDVLINTTPVEMYPNNEKQILSSLEGFNNLKGVVDVIYNPLRTNLTLKAREASIASCNGLFMLIAQAFYAIEIFLDVKLSKQIIVSLYEEILRSKENIVLIGMPGCGKTTVGRKLANSTNLRFVDVDEEIIKIINMPIKDYFKKYGEEAFRDIESQVIKEVSKSTNCVISTGGGSILRKENINALKQNGTIYFLDRDINKLVTTSSRPLSSNYDDLKKRYDERYHIYRSASDVRINANAPKFAVVNKILSHKIAGGK